MPGPGLHQEGGCALTRGPLRNCCGTRPPGAVVMELPLARRGLRGSEVRRTRLWDARGAAHARTRRPVARSRGWFSELSLLCAFQHGSWPHLRSHPAWPACWQPVTLAGYFSERRFAHVSRGSTITCLTGLSLGLNVIICEKCLIHNWHLKNAGSLPSPLLSSGSIFYTAFRSRPAGRVLATCVSYCCWM